MIGVWRKVKCQHAAANPLQPGKGKNTRRTERVERSSSTKATRNRMDSGVAGRSIVVGGVQAERPSRSLRWAEVEYEAGCGSPTGCASDQRR